MTFSDLLKVMIIQCQITRKWYNIQLSSRKSYMIYQMAPFLMTLNDLYPVSRLRHSLTLIIS